MSEYYCKTECEHREECAGAEVHNGEGCKCHECPTSDHVLVIKNPPKLSFPCHHGHKCSCNSGKTGER